MKNNKKNTCKRKLFFYNEIADRMHAVHFTPVAKELRGDGTGCPVNDMTNVKHARLWQRNNASD
jgi:hypothetical protein